MTIMPIAEASEMMFSITEMPVPNAGLFQRSEDRGAAEPRLGRSRDRGRSSGRTLGMIVSLGGTVICEVPTHEERCRVEASRGNRTHHVRFANDALLESSCRLFAVVSFDGIELVGLEKVPARLQQVAAKEIGVADIVIVFRPPADHRRELAVGQIGRVEPTDLIGRCREAKPGLGVLGKQLDRALEQRVGFPVILFLELRPCRAVTSSSVL